MIFPNIDAAQDWSTKHKKQIYVEIEGAPGVLQVYPGGRKVFVAADKGKVYQRWRARLTPDSEFNDEAAHCSVCGYTKQDAQTHMDHHLCTNAGNAQTLMHYVPAFPKPVRLTDEDYLRFIKRQPCIVCGAASHPHHTITRKTGGSDYRTLPLCFNHHNDVHRHGRTWFEETHRVNIANELVRFLELYVSALKSGVDLGRK